MDIPSIVSWGGKGPILPMNANALGMKKSQKEMLNYQLKCDEDKTHTCVGYLEIYMSTQIRMKFFYF